MKNKTLFYIELPPPVHGMTYINKIIFDGLKSKENYHFHNVDFSNEVSDIGKRGFGKVWQNLKIVLGAWKSFFQVIPTQVYSIVSATKFGIIRDFAILIPSLLFKKRLVLHLHGFTYYKIYQHSKLYKFLFDVLSKNAVIIVLCENQKNQTLTIMSKDSVVLNNCINEKSSVVERKVKNKILQICYISNISRQKGTLDLIKAVQNRKDIKLVVAGNFLSEKEDFLELANQCDNISYVGFADEKIKKEIFESSDIFCLPSKLEEGSPISIIEAMSYGLPVIASDKGCIADMIDGAGYVLQQDYDTTDITKGIEFIANNYNTLSTNAIKKYQGNYLQEKFMENLENILQGEIKNV
jgi:glycosyltransferase involved in cell wall biosynthesis